MPISLEALRALIKPENTVLLLGAGASVTSGAPSGKSLAHQLWKKAASSEPMSDDLVESASIIERRFGRAALIKAVVESLSQLKPTGGILGIPSFEWSAIYSTNFDRLIEQSYKISNIPLTTIRSNFDFSTKENRSGTTLYKIHGCITQDRSLGDKSSMIITEQDYEEFNAYRQSLFSMLQTSLLTGNVLIVGQSLRDPHLLDLVKKVLGFKQTQQGTPGEVYLLIYDRDDLRAPLLEDKGARIAFGGLDDLIHAFAKNIVSPPPAVGEQLNLPVSIVSSVIQVEHGRAANPNVVRMFNGGSASYADIRAGDTFERSRFSQMFEKLSTGSEILITIIGAAGVGKTTFGRQLASALFEHGISAYEHKNDFAFQSAPWISFENDLRSKGSRAVLLLDECSRYLRQVNILVEHLASIELPSLKLILTANAAQWTPRLKSAKIYSRGSEVSLNRLDQPELHSLVNLLEFNSAIAGLVQKEFRLLTRNQQLARLKERCSADMFVCLNNIFANDNLDTILLSEYEELSDSSREYYRYVAALESVGMRVHRQLIVRMLGIQSDQIPSILGGLQGIVDEFEIKARDGIFGWSTRHIVIARKITDYKFSSAEEIYALFSEIISNVNPAVPTEIQSIRDICDTDYGIGRIPDGASRQELYKKLIEVAPGERIPRHRLIRELLDGEVLEEVEYAIRDAVEAVGADAPIGRFRVRLLTLRAQITAGISAGDRLALYRQAFDLADQNVNKHGHDKHSYRTLCGAAFKLVEKGEPLGVLDYALNRMKTAAQDILDPEMDRDIHRFEEQRARL